jgi:hypothetical protein
MFGFVVCMNTIIIQVKGESILKGRYIYLFDTSEDHPESTGVYRNK